MAGSALRRLMAEYKRKIFWKIVYLFNCLNNNKNFVFFIELSVNPPEGIVAGPVSEDNFFEWESLIT